jgi:glycerophosphoryl diester phosphodiesterase
MGLAAARPSTRIYGHRGSRLRRPDNTVESFRLAVAEGADGIETDVRQLRDGSLILFNPELVGDRPTNTFSFDELAHLVGDELCRPDELSVIADEAELILEVKERGCEQRLVDLVGSFPSTVICSFDHRVIAELARLRVVTSASFLLGVTIAGRLIGGPSYVREIGAEWFFPAAGFIDEETVAEFADEGIAVVPWVLNDERQWASAVLRGCHGFITDDPLAASTWLASSGSQTA